MNVADITKYFAQALALLNALIAGGVVKSSTGTDIATLLADVQSIVNGVQSPTANEVDAVTKFLDDAKAEGLLGGKLVDQSIGDLSKFKQLVSDVQSTPPQSIILDDKASFAGVKGVVAFCPLGSDQATSLGY